MRLFVVRMSDSGLLLMKPSCRLALGVGLSLFIHGILLGVLWPSEPIPLQRLSSPLQLQLMAPPATTQHIVANRQGGSKRQAQAPAVVLEPVSPAKSVVAVAPSPSVVATGAQSGHIAASSASFSSQVPVRSDTASTVTPARYLGNVQNPPYPEAARARGEEGTVEIRVTVAADGQVQQVALLRSSGFDELDQTALDLLRRGPYAPAQRAGEPIASRLKMVVPFRLAY